MQGPVHFNQNGIRDVAELKVLQYRTSYLNGTVVRNGGSLSRRLMLVEVAYVMNDTESLEFLDGDKSTIWPGTTQLLQSLN